MGFESYVREQIVMHPSVQPQDIVKLCFQAAFGAEHLLNDLETARRYFEKEYEQAEPKDIVLYEKIADTVCRINLSTWKFYKFSPVWLFQMFAASARVEHTNIKLFENTKKIGHNSTELFENIEEAEHNSMELFECYLEIADKTLKTQQVSFSFEEWKSYVEQYKKNGITSVHHSEKYRTYEKPSYRIVNSQFLRLLPILKKIKEQVRKDNKVCVIAIDGRAASGKSTIAKQLKEILDADIIQMDHFFLPISLRTQERYQTVGGNIHYERFMQEVLPYLSLPKKFSYQKFDCHKMDYSGECVIQSADFRIVEGSYSCHPLFGEYADITVFSDVGKKEQLTRILHRNGKEMAEIFREKWIVLEEKYFEKYQIAKKVDINL